MSDQTDSTKRLILPRVAPHGGSKWAAQFAGPGQATIAGAGLLTLPGATIHPDQRVTQDDEGDMIEETVFALAAGKSISLGRFIAGPLGLALTSKVNKFAGAPLTPRQTDILARLGRLRDFVALTEPRRFRAVMVAAAMPPAAVPGPAIRPLLDQLRAPAVARTNAVAILPARDTEKFCLANRASLAAWLRAKRITLIEPEALRLAELTELLAAARLVLLADPLQSGLLGLCHPGTNILEIAPEGWLGPQARVISSLCGLNWAPFLAAPPSYPLGGTLPFGSLVPCSYEISIRDLAKILDRIAPP